MTDALTGGCLVRHPRTFRMLRPNGTDHFVVLLIRTYGEFQIKEHLYKAYPNHALILAPHTDYSYGNPNGEYIDDYMHFQTNDETYF